jgi:hypothetical protein
MAREMSAARRPFATVENARLPVRFRDTSISCAKPSGENFAGWPGFCPDQFGLNKAQYLHKDSQLYE